MLEVDGGDDGERRMGSLRTLSLLEGLQTGAIAPDPFCIYNPVASSAAFIFALW